MVNIVKKKMKPNIKMILIVKNIETDLKKSGLNSLRGFGMNFWETDKDSVKRTNRETYLVLDLKRGILLAMDLHV